MASSPQLFLDLLAHPIMVKFLFYFLIFTTFTPLMTPLVMDEYGYT